MRRVFQQTPKIHNLSCLSSLRGLATKSTSAPQQDGQSEKKADPSNTNQIADDAKKPEKTQAELDEELRIKLAGLSGEGGDAGVEYEDGKPVSMKRGVRENMFRYI